MKRALHLLLGAAAAAALAPAVCNADSLTDELKAQEDPTILKRRVWSDTEWNRFKDGSRDFEETLGGLWAWRVADSQDWGIRLKVPYAFHTAGSSVGDSDRQGLGDIKLATGTAFRHSDAWRSSLGLELRLPTAAENLGSDVWRLQLFGSVAWDATRTLTLSPSFEYNKSIAEKAGVAPQRFLEVFLPAIFLLPQRWSVTARYETKIDYENHNDWTNSAKLVVSKLLQDEPLGFSVSVKKPLDGSDKKYQVNFVATYFFR